MRAGLQAAPRLLSAAPGGWAEVALPAELRESRKAKEKAAGSCPKAIEKTQTNLTFPFIRGWPFTLRRVAKKGKIPQQ